MELQISKDIVTRALMIQEGNNPFSSVKLTYKEKRMTFKSDKAKESFYDNLRDEAIKLPL